MTRSGYETDVFLANALDCSASIVGRDRVTGAVSTRSLALRADVDAVLRGVRACGRSGASRASEAGVGAGAAARRGGGPGIDAVRLERP